MRLSSPSRLCRHPQGSITTQTPYGPHPADFLSNVRNFKIIESTLREGEQFANAFFNLEVGLSSPLRLVKQGLAPLPLLRY